MQMPTEITIHTLMARLEMQILHFSSPKERTMPESFPKMIFYDKIVSVGS